MQWFDRFKLKRQADRSIVGIEIGVDGLTGVVLVREGTARPVVLRSAFVASDESGWCDAIEALLNELSVERADLSVCFTPAFYDLMLIDAPEVADDELTQAVKWRVKDLLPADVDDYVIDAFRLPDDAFRGRMSMIYVACIDHARIRRLVDCCDASAVSLSEISISELTQCRLFNSDEVVDQSIAVVDLQKDEQGRINLMENRNLYLSRNIDMDSEIEDIASETSESGQTIDLGSLALDIQRSLDYYESQLGKAGVSTIYLAANQSLSDSFIEQMDKQIAVRVRALDPAEWISFATTPDRVSSCFSAAGAAMGVNIDG